jgi:hypothetical protein
MGYLAVDYFVLGFQFFSCFSVIGIGNTAINRANSRTLRLIKGAHTLRAFVGVNLINLIASKYRFVRTFRITGSTIDTFFGDFICHFKASSKK